VEADFYLRPYRPSDINFIRNSWSSSYYKGADFVHFLSPNEFNRQHRPVREALLSKPNATVIVACGKRDDDLLLGWILVEKTNDPGIHLHYIYVKEAFKGEGIFYELLDKALPEKPIMVTHMTDRARKIIRKKKKDYFKDFVFAPDTIMVRYQYLNTLPRSEEWFLKNGQE